MNTLLIVGTIAVAAVLGAAALILRPKTPLGDQDLGAAPAPAPANSTRAVGNTPKPMSEINPERLEESRNLLFRMIADLGTSIQQLVGVAASYDAGLAEHEARLQQRAEEQDLDKMCEDILSELHDMREANAKYKVQLAETQEKLREREAEVASLQIDMNTDYLTRILNRRGLEARIAEEMARAKRYDAPFSIVLFDIDFFKHVNDEHGHAAGDKVIRLVAHTLEEHKRTNDSAGRYGGEEFMLLLPAATAEQAAAVAERARKQMERFVTRFNDARIRVTISGGVTQFKPDDDTVETLIQRVDKGLYAAKSNGRNRIEIANGE